MVTPLQCHHVGACGTRAAFINVIHNVLVDVKGNVEVLDRIEKAFDWAALEEDPLSKENFDDRMSISKARMDLFPQLRQFIHKYGLCRLR